MVRVQEDGQMRYKNEVRDYIDLKSYGSAESSWRLFEFQISMRYPSVKRLPVHLENMQTVYFHEEYSTTEMLETAKATELTAFF